MNGFHTHDGWYWRRRSDGSVAIIVTESAKDGAPIVREHYLPENEWASVVASVSRDGETHDRWMAARNFHGLTRLDAVAALRGLIAALERHHDKYLPPFAPYATAADIAAYDDWRDNVSEALKAARLAIEPADAQEAKPNG